MLHFGKQNGTSELDTPFLSKILSSIAERTTSPNAQLSLKRKAPVVLGPRDKIGRSEQKEADSVVLAPLDMQDFVAYEIRGAHVQSLWSFKLVFRYLNLHVFWS
jgi:hypothetical protein